MLAVGTNDGIVVIEKDSQDWKVAGRALEGLRIEDVQRTDTGTIVATEQGIFESTDDWVSWKCTLENVDVRCLAIASDGTAYAGADNALLFRRRASEEAFAEVLSFRELPTYETWTFPVSPHVPNIRSIVISRMNPQRVYVGVEVGGVMLTEDGGESWCEARESMHPDIHGLAVAPGEKDHLFAVTGVGFFKTVDGGQSWHARSEGFEDLYSIAVANDPSNPERVFASATAGRPRNWRERPSGAIAKVYKSDDGGDQWESLMPQGLIEAIDALAVDREGTVFAGTYGGQVLAYEAQASAWVVAADGLQAVNSLRAL